MKVEATALPGVLIVTPVVHDDARGSFREIWQRDRYAHAGLATNWAQDNVSVSHRHVLRGLHFQYPDPQGKLVTAMSGAILDVAVDIRIDSPTFGQFVAVELTADNARQLWIPEEFAHGFVVLSDQAIVHYKVTRPYNASFDRTLAWDDPDIGIDWRIPDPLLSSKDAKGRRLADFGPHELPRYTTPA